MNPINKKAKAIKQPLNRPGHVKPVVAQLKPGVPAKIAAPPVYKPQPLQKVLQAKMATSTAKPALTAQSVKRPVAPPVYRPQATTQAVQPKMANGAGSRKAPVAPPVYRPQQTPKVLQKKSSPSANPFVRQAPVGPPVNRPAAAKIIQPKMAARTQTSLALPTAPNRVANAGMGFAARLPNRYVIQRAMDEEWLPDGSDASSSSSDDDDDIDAEIDLATSPNLAQWTAGVAEGYADGWDDGIKDERMQLANAVRPTMAAARLMVGNPTAAMIAAAQVVPLGTTVVVGDERDDGLTYGRGLGYTAGANEAFRILGWRRANYPAIPAARRVAALAYNGGNCVYCNAAVSTEVDHVYPIQKHWVTLGYRGATLADVNDADNLVGSCAACNGAKSNTYLNAWNGHTWAAGQWFPHGPPAGTIPIRRGAAIAWGGW
jgi:hypothetical protein